MFLLSWGCPSFINWILSSFERPLNSLVENKENELQILMDCTEFLQTNSQQQKQRLFSVLCGKTYKINGWSQAGLFVFFKVEVLYFCGGSSICSTHRGFVLPTNTEEKSQSGGKKHCVIQDLSDSRSNKMCCCKITFCFRHFHGFPSMGKTEVSVYGIHDELCIG